MNFLGKDCDTTKMHSDCQESHDQSHMSWSKVKFPDRNSPSSSAKHQAELGDVVNFDGTSCYPWTLQCIEGRGFCAFSNRKYSKGDLILTESPTVWVDGHHPFTQKQIVEIEGKTQNLSAYDKKAFFDMANVFPELSPSVGIFMTNSFDMAGTEFTTQGLACGMYVALARLNHSCVPNVQQTHVPATGEEVLYASRDIEIGDEICDCYIDLRQSKDQRRKELLENFRFLCSCSACSNEMCVSTEDSTYKHDTEIDRCTYNISPTGSDDYCQKDISHNTNSIIDNRTSCNGSYINQSISKSTADDDASRLHAASFEDESIEYITQGLNQRALRVLIQGIAVLMRKENEYWSIRYVSSAHLSAYQILNQIILDKQSKEDSVGKSRGRQNDSNYSHNSNNDAKRKRFKKSDAPIIEETKLKKISGVADEESSVVTQMRYHLKEAHSGNICLQGSLTPDSINTLSLMKKHNLI